MSDIEYSVIKNDVIKSFDCTSIQSNMYYTRSYKNTKNVVAQWCLTRDGRVAGWSLTRGTHSHCCVLEQDTLSYA